MLTAVQQLLCHLLVQALQCAPLALSVQNSRRWPKRHCGPTPDTNTHNSEQQLTCCCTAAVPAYWDKAVASRQITALLLTAQQLHTNALHLPCFLQSTAAAV